MLYLLWKNIWCFRWLLVKRPNWLALQILHMVQEAILVYILLIELIICFLSSFDSYICCFESSCKYYQSVHTLEVLTVNFVGIPNFSVGNGFRMHFEYATIISTKHISRLGTSIIHIAYFYDLWNCFP